MSVEPFNVLVTGMGGQGCVSLGRSLSVAAARAGWRVAGSEKRGGAQRGGAAEVTLRLLPPDGLPESAYGGTVPPGQLDLLIGLEPLEAWRRVGLTSSRTLALVDGTAVEPALSRGFGYAVPPFATILEGIGAAGARVVALDLSGTARREWGKEAMANVLALAWLAQGNHFPFDKVFVREAMDEVLGAGARTERAWSAGQSLQSLHDAGGRAGARETVPTLELGS